MTTMIPVSRKVSSKQQMFDKRTETVNAQTPKGMNAMTQVTNSYELVNVRESQANSTKQTVYQMKSSRTGIPEVTVTESKNNNNKKTILI